MNPTDPTQNNQAPDGYSPGFSSSGVDIPPAPQPIPQAAMPGEVPPPPTAAVPPPPPVSTNTAPPPPPANPNMGGSPLPVTPLGSMDSQPSMVTPKRESRLPKGPIVAVLILIFLLLGGFSFAKFVLPRLSGGVSGNSTISWWGMWEDPKTVQPLIDEYQTAHPGVTIKYEQKSKEQYRERLSNAIAGGQGPDIMTIHNSWVPMFKTSLSPMPASVFSPQEFQQTFYPVMSRDLTLGTSIVGIPSEYDGLGLFVNDEIFSTYGKDVPTTWNDLRNTAISLTIKNNQGIIQQAGIAMGTTSNIDHWQEILALLMLQNGAKLESPTGSFAEGALDFYTVFSKTDKVWDDTLPNSTTMFANGKLAMMIAPSWRAHDIIAVSPTLKFRVLPVPQLPKNSPDEPDITYATYWVNAVSAKSANQTAAWEFMKFLSTKESYQKLYDNAAKIRTFGEPFPRVDMREAISADPKVGGFISLAGNAKSWYLDARTFDGETGINSRIGKYFEDAVNAVNKGFGTGSKEALVTASSGVLQVLVDYGLASAPPVTK